MRHIIDILALDRFSILYRRRCARSVPSRPRANAALTLGQFEVLSVFVKVPSRKSDPFLRQMKYPRTAIRTCFQV